MSFGGGPLILSSKQTHDEEPRGLTERQLYALRKRLAAGVDDPELTLRGSLVSDTRRYSSERFCGHPMSRPGE